MPTHAEAIAERLPTLYRDGEVLAALLGVVGLQMEIVEEEARKVQRAHWIGTTNELSEAARLGAALDIPAEEWQGLGEYRAWFHALRTARLRHGAVTREALQGFASQYGEAFEEANEVGVLPPFTTWASEPVKRGHAIVENPERFVSCRIPDVGAVEPLQRRTVVNGGLDPAPLSFLMTGTGAAPEHVPVVANVTTGEALAFLGVVPPGARLWVRATGDGEGEGDGVVAELEGVDVTASLRHVHGFSPGRSWTDADISDEPQVLRLDPGANDVWFLTVAHYDEPGLDRALLALASLDLRQGRWDETRFDQSLFAQAGAVVLHLCWMERQPATVEVDLDGAVMTCPAGAVEAATESRERLAATMDAAIADLAAAGVSTAVRLRPLVDSQRQRDRLAAVLPITQREVGVVGIGRISNAGGLFGVTGFNESTYR